MIDFWAKDEDVTPSPFGTVMSLKGNIAVELVTKWGTVAGRIQGEDSAGRAVLDVEEPTALVERCCTIADLLIEAIHSRGWIREFEGTLEERFEQSGRLERIKLDAMYPNKNPVGV